MREFAEEDLLKVTSGYKRIIGKGASGTVYEGTLQHTSIVYVQALIEDAIHTLPRKCSLCIAHERIILHTCKRSVVFGKYGENEHVCV